MKFRCARCAADLRPANFGSDRNCAFAEDGAFTPDNWNCATIEALLSMGDEHVTEVWGDDESLQVLRGEPYCGFLVFTRYKRRGCASSAVLVGDFWPPRPLTLKMAEQWIAGTFANDDEPDVADVSSRLQQLEAEKGMLIEKIGGLGATCDDALLRAEQSEARVQQLEQEKATLETELKELRARVDSQGVNHEAVVPRPPTGA